MEIAVIGLGLGAQETMTLEARRALEQADCVLGARRLLESLPDCVTSRRTAEIRPQALADYLKEHSEFRRPCVVMSGDTGFYSGAKKLLPLLDFCPVRVLPGLSSPQYLAARLAIPWQDFQLVSAHGAGEELDPAARGRVRYLNFFPPGGRWRPEKSCRARRYGVLGDADVAVGENLSYPTERICRGTAAQMQNRQFAPLAVLLARRPPDFSRQSRAAGIPDDQFLRGKAPMTKQEVRAVSLAKLAPEPEDVVWDVGAGTGSVSVEAALLARRGRVYAVECQPEAWELLQENKRKFRVGNLFPVLGMAPEALKTLPPPDGVFVGGSKGNLAAVLQEALRKNPSVRVVVNAVTLETLRQAMEAMERLGFCDMEIAQIAVSRAKSIGDYHMMTALNPVFVVSGRGPGGGEEHDG